MRSFKPTTPAATRAIVFAAILFAANVSLVACAGDPATDGSTATDATGGGQDVGNVEDLEDSGVSEQQDVPEVDIEGRLKEIGQSVKKNGLFSQITEVGGDPNTVFHGCAHGGTGKTYIAGTNGTVIGHDGLTWQTLSEGTFATLNGIATAPNGTLAHAAGIKGTVIQAKGKSAGLATQWGPPGGCKVSTECNDGDSCTTDYCDTGVCQHVPSKAAGCCGSVPLSDGFDNIGNWTVSDIFASNAKSGGVVWNVAALKSVTGEPRYTSPASALYFGIANQACTADPSKICPTYDNGNVVGSVATSAWMSMPVSEKITLTFQLLMDVRDSYPDDLRVYVEEQGKGKKAVWTKLNFNSYKGTTGGKFVLQTVDLSSFSAKKIRLQLEFNAKYYGANAMGGEGVYIDDLLLSTACGAGELAGAGLTDATFFDIHAPSDEAAWAVGTSGTIARWDGKDWLLETGGAVRDIHAFDGVPGILQLLVGQQGLVASFGPTGMKPYDHKLTTADLWDVAVTPASEPVNIHAVAVGNIGTVLELDKGAWKKGTFPSPITLTTVAADGSGGYIAGGSSLIYRRNAASGMWTLAGTLPAPIYASAWMGGGKYLVAGANGKNVEVTSTAIVPKTDVSQFALRSISALGPKSVWMVGDSATIANFDGVKWNDNKKPFTQNLRGVWAANDSDVFAVGLGGTIGRFDGTAWKSLQGPQGVDWLAVWGTDPNDVYAAGKGGLLARYNGLAWTVIGGPVTGTLRGVWASSDKDVWAVGEGAAIYHSKGDGSWKPVQIEPYQIPQQDPKIIKEDLYAIWGSGPDDIWAVGTPDKHSEATLLHYDGKVWQFVPALGTETRLFRAIWGWHKGSILFVGTQGMVYHYNGSEFSELPSGSITTFHDVCGFGKDALLVGGIGTVLRYIPPASFRKPAAEPEQATEPEQ